MDKVSIISILVLLMVLLLPIMSHLMRRHTKLVRIGSYVMLAVYLFANLYLTMLSRPVRMYHHMQLKLFWSFARAQRGDKRMLAEIILNVLLYVPLGYLLHYAFPKLRAWQVVMIGVLLSGLTECIQLFFKLGLCEIDDLITNTTGTVLGVGSYWGMKKLMRRMTANAPPKD